MNRGNEKRMYEQSKYIFRVGNLDNKEFIDK